MTEQDLQLTLPDGTADAVLFTPDADHPLPGILFIPDIGSIRDTKRQMARRLAAESYVVLMPNEFYRTSRPPVFSFPRKSGDPATTQRIAELSAPLTPEALGKDLAVYLDTLAAHTSGKKIGVVGFCIGGGIALRAAAVRPDLVAAVASFHGGGLYKANSPASPHLVLPKVNARLYFGHATDDKSMDADAIMELVKALKAWGGRFESEIYEGSHHGWTVPDNPAYNQPQAERAYAKLIELFRETLS
ncbi:dienelactone hydrolase family protein [Edaphobacter albus]|uniref:dienelactone hydrolase family protein n=1 Tax=Edaphobacter sp. 4G125 TaxID=2763071 RepID=UPI00164698A5|nr:dienelactone hydrolase family protein [Edaphobacter sp. 4G125]QNI38213.1 dienelactone hydrolase family protein [Edaphobacter sp. 4G125]